MRRYDIVSGILLILSIIDLALAAPVLVQEKRQACVDVVHIPTDVIAVLGKRGVGDLEHVVEEYFKTWEKPVESSDAHASSSSAPPRPDHGSTGVVQPNPASSTANPGLLTEPSSPSLTASSVKGVSPPNHPLYEGVGELHDVPLDSPASSEHGSDDGLTGAHAPLPKLPNPNPGPSTDSVSLLDPPPPRPASQKEFGQAYTSGYPVEHVQQPNPGPSADSNFDWDYWMNLEDPSPPKPEPPKPSTPKPSTKSGFNWKYWANPLNLMDPLTPEGRQALSKPSNPKPSTKSGVDWQHWLSKLDPLPRPGWSQDSKPLNPRPSYQPSYQGPGPSNPGPSNPRLTINPDRHPNLMVANQPPAPLRIRPTKVEPPEETEKEVAPGPPPTPELADPELNSDPQSLSADPQPVDLLHAIYAAKGKAKQSRRISGTARDVGNAAEGDAAC